MALIKRNAIILAAGTSSRFIPLSKDIHKALLEVKGEILIERQIRQLQEAGIHDITVVVGYKAETFEYLKRKFNIHIVFNEDYKIYNNTSSLIRVLDKLENTYICSADNYFSRNVFLGNPVNSFYSAKYANHKTEEYCLITNKHDEITDVVIGGQNIWFMIGHVFFDKNFSNAFKEILKKEYDSETTRTSYWEDVYIKYIKDLPPLKIYRYSESDILEFDTLNELRLFDSTYVEDTRSTIIKSIAARLNCKESDLTNFVQAVKEPGNQDFYFSNKAEQYYYESQTNTFRKL